LAAKSIGDRKKKKIKSATGKRGGEEGDADRGGERLTLNVCTTTDASTLGFYKGEGAEPFKVFGGKISRGGREKG